MGFGRSDKPANKADYSFLNHVLWMTAWMEANGLPTSPNDPERQNNERAWELFKRWDKPFLMLFSDHDPVTRCGHTIWQRLVPRAKDQTHALTRGAGHFLQEDKGAEVALAMVTFLQAAAVPDARKSVA